MAGTHLPIQAVRSLMKKSGLLPFETGGRDVRNVNLGVFESAVIQLYSRVFCINEALRVLAKGSQKRFK